jgi:hypothetical protein
MDSDGGTDAEQKLLSAILVVLPATAALMARTTVVEAIADECKTRPGATTVCGGYGFKATKPGELETAISEAFKLVSTIWQQKLYGLHGPVRPRGDRTPGRRARCHRHATGSSRRTTRHPLLRVDEF